MLISLSLFITSIIALWIGSGKVVTTVEKLARQLGLSSFLVSFFILGAATSTPEISVGINSIIDNTPQVFVGNYIGGAIVILMLIIPILAILSGKIDLKHHISQKTLGLTLLSISAPIIISLDQKITIFDALLCFTVFLTIIPFLKNEHQFRDNFSISTLAVNKRLYKNLATIIGGIVIVFAASDIIVSQTIKVSAYLNISPFVVSLLLLSLGTNLPEFSIAIRSAYLNKKAVAFGNYLGSAAFNTLLLAIMTFAHGRDVEVRNHAGITLSIFLVGIVLFFLFARTKHTISRWEASILFGFYIAIVFTETLLNFSHSP